MHKRAGFTLIELLVVISIIAILSVVGLTSYTSFLNNSRDARRQSDLKFIQSALEEYHADQLYYPDQDSLTFGSPLEVGSRTYLTKVPNDPTANQDYSYVPYPADCDNTDTNCTNYCLFAQLEGTPPSSDTGCTLSGYNYGVTRP